MDLLKILVYTLLVYIMMFLFCCTEPDSGSISASSVVAQGVQSKPVRVYMIYNTVDNAWYSTNTLGMVTWVGQNKALVWTIKGNIEKVYSGLSKRRKSGCQIKVFVLLPVSAGT